MEKHKESIGENCQNGILNAKTSGTPRPNVPALRFPEFTEEWKKCTIKDYGEVITGNTPPTKNIEYYSNGSYLWASPADLGLSKHITSTKTKLSLLGLKKTRTIPQGSILVTCIGSTIGKMGMATETMSTNQQINSVIVNDSTNNDFAYYAILNAFPRYLSEVGVQAVPILSKSNFEKLPNHTTTKEEQRKLGYFLNLLDERIATQNKIIEKLETLIKGLNNILLYGTRGKSVCLGDILLERSERSRTNNQHEVLSSTVKGIFSQREYFSKDIASENNVGYKIIRLHDVVLSPQNLWMGNINYNDRFEIGIVSPSYKVFSIADGYDNQFVAAMLKTHRALYSYMMVSEQGASIVRRNLNMEAFSQLVFKIPSLDKQRKIGCAISLLKSQLKTANKIIRAYTSQKLYLLRQMFI